MAHEATIVARASGEGPAAIALLRLSGSSALPIARQCLPNLPPEPEVRRLYLSAFVDAVGEPLDEVLAAYFQGPRSYTGEDVVEVSAHGGTAVVGALERRLIELGARRAEPGEFTQRAVRNERMDVLDAEALAALLAAESESELALARKAGGEGAAEMRALLREARAALAEARGAEDHPLETAEEALGWRAVSRGLAERCELLAAGPSMERQLQEGHRVVLLGPVNAGKSSLFNLLLGTRRALVDSSPGTTRDAVSSLLFLEGKKVTLYDTAGIRDVGGVERLGMDMGLEAASGADLVIWVEDGSQAPEHHAEELTSGLTLELRVESKADLPRSNRRGEGGGELVRVSALTGEGVEGLKTRILERLGRMGRACSARQQCLLKAAGQDLAEASQGPDDLAAAALERGVWNLARLVGAPGVELDEEIYRRFCIGK